MQEDFVEKGLYLTLFFKILSVISLYLSVYYFFKMDIPNILIWLGIFLMTFKLIIFPINLKENIFSRKEEKEEKDINYKRIKLISDIGLIISFSGIFLEIFL